MSVSGDSSGGMYVISGLTTYSIQVAAETSAGTGPYSGAITYQSEENYHLIKNYPHM